MVQNSKSIKEYSLKVIFSHISFSHQFHFLDIRVSLIPWVSSQRTSMQHIQNVLLWVYFICWGPSYELRGMYFPCGDNSLLLPYCAHVIMVEWFPQAYQA